jgi:hypothetical protein
MESCVWCLRTDQDLRGGVCHDCLTSGDKAKELSFPFGSHEESILLVDGRMSTKTVANLCPDSLEDRCKCHGIHPITCKIKYKI